ncbi:hypothetical protein ACFLFF_30555, partial [Brevibacillus reuszeri]|uniref:hypothetical protein n=1 Tax=Brevibacillus reuszeri TaxID=54915 RepID=UPI00366A8855
VRNEGLSMKEFNLSLTQVELAATVDAIKLATLNGTSERNYADGHVNYADLEDKFRKVFQDQKLKGGQTLCETKLSE